MQRSNAKRDAGAGGRGQNLAGHLPLRFLGEVEPAAMHRNQDVRIQLADLAYNLSEVIRRGRPEVEAAHDRVDLLDARYFHRLPDGIDDADVAARTDNDETLILQIEAGGVLMDVLIGHDLAFHFGRQIVARVATGALL